jgi:hypothetical protein
VVVVRRRGSTLFQQARTRPAAARRRTLHRRVRIVRNRDALFVIAIVVCGPRPHGAGAQLSASLEAAAARATYEGYLPSGVYTLTPALGLTVGPAAAYADAALTKFESGNTSEFGELGASYTVGSAPFSLTARVDGSSSWYRSYEPVSAGLAGLRAQLRINSVSGVWVGGAAGVSNALLGGTDDVHGVGRGDLGAWFVARPFVFVGSVTGTAAGDSAYMDAVGTVRLELPRLSLSGTVGARAGSLGGGVPRWVQADVRVPLVSTLSLVGAIGSTPTDLVRGLPGAQYASLGLRVTVGRVSAPPAGAVRRETPVDLVIERDRTVEIREPPGSRVEVMGDFTEWRPVLCPEISPGVFALAVPRTHGLYRIDVRVDGGAWTVPPGLAAVPDDFGGEVGLLVVP